MADADTFFQIELPAVQEWKLTREQTAAITVPVLYLQGERTWPIFDEVREVIHGLLPQTQDALIPDATHLLQLESPHAVAEPLGTYFSQN